MRRTPHHTATIYAQANYLLGKRCIELRMPMDALTAFEAAGSIVPPPDWVDLADLFIRRGNNASDRRNATICYRHGNAPLSVAYVVRAALDDNKLNEAFVLLEDMGPDAPEDLWVALGDALIGTRQKSAAAAYLAGGASDKLARIENIYPNWWKSTVGEKPLASRDLTTARWIARITRRPITPATFRAIGRRALKEGNTTDAYDAFLKAGELVTPAEWRRLGRALDFGDPREMILHCCTRSGNERLLKLLATEVLRQYSLQEALPLLRVLSPDSLHDIIVCEATVLIENQDTNCLSEAMALCADAGVQPRRDVYQAWGKLFLRDFSCVEAARCFLLAEDKGSFTRVTDAAVTDDVEGAIAIFKRVAREEMGDTIDD